MSTSDPYTTPGTVATNPDQQQRPLTTKELLTSFEGRIPRRTYWQWAIISGLAFAVIAGIVGAIFGGTKGSSGGVSPIFIVLMLVLYVPFLWVAFALQAKRWHDRNKSGWWILIGFVPIIGGIWAFVEVGCLRGTIGRNDYGNDPT